MAYDDLPFFRVAIDAATRHARVVLNRPEAANAMNAAFWDSFPELIRRFEADKTVRYVSFSGEGKHFSAGLDLKQFYNENRHLIHAETADLRAELFRLIRHMQTGFNAMADGNKIYIAAIHGSCIGGGLDFAAACDMRLASADANISLREARVGIVADLGSLQRLPAIIGMAQTKRLALTAEDIGAEEAARIGLVQSVHADKAALLEAVDALVAQMSANPFMAVSGSKRALAAVEKLGAEAGLEHIALFNAAYLDTEDFREFIMATLEGRQPTFT